MDDSHEAHASGHSRTALTLKCYAVISFFTHASLQPLMRLRTGSVIDKIQLYESHIGAKRTHALCLHGITDSVNTLYETLSSYFFTCAARLPFPQCCCFPHKVTTDSTVLYRNIQHGAAIMKASPLRSSCDSAVCILAGMPLFHPRAVGCHWKPV